MRISAVTFFALAACASTDAKITSEARQRLLENARKLSNNGDNSDNSNGNSASNYMSNMQYYQNSWNGNGNGDYYKNGGYGNNQNNAANYENQNYENQDQEQEDQDYQDEDNQNDGYNDEYQRQYEGYGQDVSGSTNWMSEYSLQFEGCATDYDGNADGMTTELLARFRLCPNKSGRRCGNSGEYVLPMAEFVDATQKAFATDENCRLQEETCYAKCQQQARYGYQNDDNDEDDGKRKLSDSHWWQKSNGEQNDEQQANSETANHWWQKWGVNNNQNTDTEEEHNSREEEEQNREYQQEQYNNVNYNLYNGGNNGVAAHNGDYNAAENGQNTYSSQYQKQMEQYSHSSTTGSHTGTGTTSSSTTTSSTYDSNNNYYNRGNWRNSGNTDNSDGSSGYQDSSSYGDSNGNVNEDNSYWGGYNNNNNNNQNNNNAYANNGNNNGYNAYQGNNQNNYQNNNNEDNDNDGNDGRNANYQNYFDEEYCRYDCMSDAGMAYCSENTEENGQNGYNDLDLAAMVDCLPLNYYDSNNNPLYTGATCKNGGVYLGTFTDAACTEPAGTGAFEEAIGYNLPDQNLVSKDKFKCSSTATIAGYFEAQDQFSSYEEWKQYASNQYETASGLCDVLYRDSGRCETNMKKDDNDKDETGCDYINRMSDTGVSYAGVWLRYGIGFVIGCGFLFAAYTGYNEDRRDEAAQVIDTIRSSATNMFNKASASLQQPLSPETGVEEVAGAPGTYVGATIPAVTGDAMDEAPIPPPIAVKHDEEPTEVKKENNVV